MQQDTQNKMAAILQAAKDKAANKTAITFSLQPVIKKEAVQHKAIEIEQPKPQEQPELSTITFDDLIPNNSQPELPKLSIVNYSDRAFAVIGEDTKKFKDDLFSLGGNFNRFLKCGAGWIFSKKRMAEVQNHFHI